MPIDQSSILTLLQRVHLFRGVEDTRLEIAADLMEQVEVPAGHVLFRQKDDPDYFYIIAEGRVRLLRYDSRTQQDLTIAYLTGDDYFGQEMLEGAWPRQVTAETVEDSTLLRISVQNFIDMLEIIPALGQRLQMILDSYRLMLRVNFNWLNPEETIYFVARRHILFLFSMILPPLAVGIIGIPVLTFVFLGSMMVSAALILFLFGLLDLAWLVWNYVDWTNDYYIVTNQRVVYQERVVLLYDSREESPLDAIQSTATNTSQLGRWFGFGNVVIRTYTGVLLFRNIGLPEQVNALIQEQQLRAQFSQRRTDLRDIKNIISERIREGPQRPKLPRPKPPQPQPSAVRTFLSTMFHLRYEVGGTIIYRTHLFILLQKIWLPSLLLFGLAALFIASITNSFPILSAGATCGLTFLVGGIVGGWWLYQYMDWHNDLYLITPDQVIDVNKKPLGHEERRAAQLNNILGVDYKRRGILGLLLNFGTVYIRVGDQTLTFDDVFNPSDVQRVLFRSLARKKNDERQAAARAERQRLADWFAVYSEMSQQNKPQSGTGQAGGGDTHPSPPKPPVRGF